MSAFYGEHAFSTTAGPAFFGQHDVHDEADNDASDVSVRYCSVRGCSSILPQEYTLKMCEACRGRHRIYANTKRAKRKLEKAAMGSQTGQPVVWMPPDDSVDGESSVRDLSVHPSEPPVPSNHVQPKLSAPLSNPPPAQHFSNWEHSIDPRLFSQTSELAGALTLPSVANEKARAVRKEKLPQAQQTQPDAVETPQANEVNSTPPEDQKSSDQSSSLSTSGTMSFDTSLLPPRYCSIKGCKALVPGNSFFRMCEPCRDRYRNYGTTKRAKWKREKEEAVAELQKIKGAEDKRRVNAGLPPFTGPIDWRPWSGDDSPEPQASTSTQDPPNPPHPPRMCTVSHCREILPGNYSYLRCERHRIQNRHHSRLKRVRDKEVKAQVFDGWAAAVSAQIGDRILSPELPDDMQSDGSMDLDDGNIDDAQYAGSLDPALGESGTGVPPMARGTRRTNHVCSIKVCHNLLSPSNPWKMCDTCRARDRSGRRMKALRESGLLVGVPVRTPRAPRVRNNTTSEKKPRRKRKRAASQEESANLQDNSVTSGLAPQDPQPESSTSQAPNVPNADQLPHSISVVDSGEVAAPILTTQTTQPITATNMIFMDPLLPERAMQGNSSTLPTHISPALDNALPPVQPSTTDDPDAGPPAKKKRSRKRKEKEVSHTDEPQAVTNPEGPASDPASSSATQPAGVPMHPQYTSYYMPPPFTLPPYGDPSRYPYPAGPPMYPGSVYTPSSMYQPAYAPYPYPYPPQYMQPYPAHQPQPPLQSQSPPPHSQVQSQSSSTPSSPPPPPSHAPYNQPPYSVAAAFVSKDDYSASVPGAANGVPSSPSVELPSGSHAFSYSTFSLKTGEQLQHTTRKKRVVFPRATTTTPRTAISGPALVQQAPYASGSVSTTTSNSPVSASTTTANALSAVQRESMNIQKPKTNQPCGNKACHRSVLASSIGVLCDRCKQRLKKRQMKAKQRYKLEPRMLVGRNSSIHAMAREGEGESFNANRPSGEHDDDSDNRDDSIEVESLMNE